MRSFIVDCFAEDRYQGNQLLAVVEDREVSDGEQQRIAREINFSETAFIRPDRRENGGFDVRIWTPHEELPFAGHPTLGAAYVIRRYLGASGDTIMLNLKVGQIPVAVHGGLLVMRQRPPVFGGTVDRNEIAAVFGLPADAIREDFPIQWVSTGLEAVIVPLKDRAALAGIRMDRQAFEAYVSRHPGNHCNHLFFTGTGERTLAARCMMEDLLEDPATGSANGCLAGYVLEHGWFGASDAAYTVIQGEDMGRRSVLHIRAAKEADAWTIEVGDRCHTVAEGNWK